MSQRFLIIANPIAGGGRGAGAAERLRDALEGAGAEAELYLTTKGGDGSERASAITPGEFFGVVSVGGDGTLNEVLNGLPDPGIRLGLLAMGTSNVLAMELALPRQPERLADVLLAGHTQTAAVGLVRDRRFLLFVSSGLDSSVVQRVTEVRKGTLGKLKYIPPILHVVLRWPVRNLSVTTGDGVTHDGLSTVIVTRVANYAGILTLPGSIHIGDGKLHVVGFRQRSRWQYLRASLRALFGRLREDVDALCIATTDRVRIDGDVEPWQIDGDLGVDGDRGADGLTGPLDIRLHPQPAHLFVPPRV